MKSCAVWLLGLASSCAAGPGSPAAATAPAPSSIAARPGDIAITDVSVVPMTSDGVLAHHTVVIRGDRIVAVAPDARVALAAGTTVIAGTGRWLMPGLADMHVHTWRDEDLTTSGRRIITGQIAELSGESTASYRFGPDTAELSSRYHTMRLALAGKIAAGQLTVTGTDLSGKPVALHAPVPAGALLSAPAMGGAIQLAERLAGMQPGGRRELTALEIDYSPSIGIAPVRYQIERKPDADGNHRFTVTAVRSGSSVTRELVIDDRGVARHTAGSEVTTRVRP